jgi:hypothetical protein
MDLDSLPRFDAVAFERVSPKYAPLVLWLSIGFYALICVGVVIANLIADGLNALIFSLSALPFIAGGLTLFALLTWLAWKSASVIRYAVREHDVIVRTGIYWRKETVQPIVRIQHVEQSQGPLDKRLGLYTLKLFSAGTGHVTFQIPGLEARTAAKLKRFLIEKTQAAQRAEARGAS